MILTAADYITIDLLFLHLYCMIKYYINNIQLTYIFILTLKFLISAKANLHLIFITYFRYYVEIFQS